MIDYLIQVLGKSAAAGTNNPQIPTRASDAVPGMVFGDALLASSGLGKAR